MYAVEKCKIPGYLKDQTSTSRETHQAYKNRKKDLIRIMTPEKQDKTSESTGSTLARNEATTFSESVKCVKICSNVCCYEKLDQPITQQGALD